MSTEKLEILSDGYVVLKMHSDEVFEEENKMKTDGVRCLYAPHCTVHKGTALRSIRYNEI